jgi:hypothetical protein
MAVLLYGVGCRGQAKPGKRILPVINGKQGLKIGKGHETMKVIGHNGLLRRTAGSS